MEHENDLSETVLKGTSEESKNISTTEMIEIKSDPLRKLLADINEITTEDEKNKRPPLIPASSKAIRTLNVISKRIEKSESLVTGDWLWKRVTQLEEMYENGEIEEDHYLASTSTIIEALEAVKKTEEADFTEEQITREQQIASGLGKALQESGLNREGSPYDVFVNAELLQQPISLQLDTFPPEWFKKMDYEQQHLIRARLRLANASFIKRRLGDIDGERTMQNEQLSLTEKELKLMWEKMPGFKESLYHYIETILEKSPESNNKAFFWTLKVKSKKEAETQLASFESLQQAYAKQLVREKIVSDELEATAAVAASWNFLFCSNIIESADTERFINPVGIHGEQVRALMHPLTKALQKYKTGEQTTTGTEEGWGGQLGDWIANRLAAGDNDFRRKLIEREIKPYPERMFASLPELTTVNVLIDKEGESIDSNKENMSMAKALSDKREIVFSDTESDLFGSYKDTWDSAFKAYNYATGKVPLESGKNNYEWARTLSDTIAKLRSKKIGNVHILEPFYKNREYILWTIANSVGLELYTSELVLRLLVPDDAYDIAVSGIVDYPRLVEDANDRKWIKRQFNAFGLFGKIKRGKISHQISREVTKRRGN